MRHPTRFSFPAAVLGALALMACSGSATATSERPRAVAVSAGIEHTCAMTLTGAVKCWGYNGHDELGDGSGASFSSFPLNVRGLGGGVAAISAGLRHSCAVTSSGAAKCWGVNYEGALGDGTTDRHGGPVDVVGLASGVTAVAAGYDRSCALLGIGSVKCWGTSFGLTPADVPGLSAGVVAISTSGLTSCALTSAGGVKCWGYHYGPTPVDVSGLAGVKALSEGSPLCALTYGGGVKCWNADSNWAPVDVPGLGSGVKELATNYGHGCVVMTTGGVKCWGSNQSGQLGDGTRIDREMPVDVSGLSSGAIDVSAGGAHSCAVMRAGGVKCWGSNFSGQLADGTRARRLRPVDVVGFGQLPASCVVPHVVGKRLAKARARIVRAHCRVGTIARVASTRSRNVVVRQSPGPGKRLQAGSKVDLSVSRG